MTPVVDSIQGRVGNRSVDVVESIEEVGAKLQPESLGEREILMQADVPVVVSGPRNPPSCGAQVPNVDRGVRDSSWCQTTGSRPLALRSAFCRQKIGIRAVAIRPQPARTRPGRITASV